MSVRSKRTARLEARTSPEALDVIKHAAALQGRSVSEFVVAAAQSEAARVIEETRVIRLTVEEQIRFAEMLLNPPEPNDAMKRAKENHARLGRQV